MTEEIKSELSKFAYPDAEHIENSFGREEGALKLLKVAEEWCSQPYPHKSFEANDLLKHLKRWCGK